MYTREQLIKYPYFADLIGENRMENLMDPLTGVIARPYIIGFARSLIQEGTPFTFAMLDLDNFKFVNDTYGHQVGDLVLQSVANKLARFMDGIGLVGRFGGDELIIVNLRDRTYDEKKDFFGAVYGDSMVLRNNLEFEDCNPFITGTIGSATFPDDAQDYDTLFTLIDKTLYRGKTKGRNCYIIYVEEKHKNIEICQIARHGVYTTMHGVARQLELVPGVLNKLRSVMPLLIEELRITDLFYVGGQGVMRSVCDPAIEESVGDLEPMMGDDVFCSNVLDSFERRCPRFYGVLRKLEIETVMVVRVGLGLKRDGYLICAEPRSRRIWQEDECAVLYFVAKLLAAGMRIEGDAIDG